ncbi:MAG: hypothetical protein H3C43_08190 [Leptonema sp. (in: Bacteria)]|nr:hypothetical protein [Leptonema sp. (in: bacteria)]
MICLDLRKHSKLIFISCLLIAGSCMPVDTGIEFEDSMSEIYAATAYKAQECGNQPSLPFIAPKNAKEYGLRLCSLSILRQECPFQDYPIFCLEMFIDLPGVGP